jgi:multisubunit Na+/H+ antiporter MnhG subunit
MGLDIRLPIGFMFVFVGLLLTGYGIFGPSEIYNRSLGINVNLGWGIVLLVFGLLMMFLGRHSLTQGKD